MVKLVKKGSMKHLIERRRLSKRRARTLMCLDHVRIMVKNLYKRPASRMLPADICVLVQQLFIFFGMQRFYDIKEAFVNSCKNDEKELGLFFALMEAMLGVFHYQEFCYCTSRPLVGEMLTTCSSDLRKVAKSKLDQ